MTVAYVLLLALACRHCRVGFVFAAYSIASFTPHPHRCTCPLTLHCPLPTLYDLLSSDPTGSKVPPKFGRQRCALLRLTAQRLSRCAK